MNNLVLRILSSLFFGFIFITLIIQGDIFFKLLIIIIFILGIFEIFKLENKKIIILILTIFLIFLSSFYNIRLSHNGIFLIFWCLSITWSTDIFAYTFGKLFGKKKIGIISPNKTYVGFFSGIVFSQLSYTVTNYFFENFNNFTLKKIVFIQLFVSISVLFGDLFFSFLKRKLNIKDFSQIMPGHGGIFDRIDGLAFSIISFNIIFIL